MLCTDRCRGANRRSEQLPHWVTATTLLWATIVRSRAELQAIVHEAGPLVGLGTASLTEAPLPP